MNVAGLLVGQVNWGSYPDGHRRRGYGHEILPPHGPTPRLLGFLGKPHEWYQNC